MRAGVQAEPEIVLYPSFWKMVLLALANLFFVLLFALYAPLAWLHGSAVIKSCAVMAIFFCGLCFLYAAGRLLRPRPSLIIGAFGVTDNASAVGAGFIGWEEIASVTLGCMNESRFLVIVPRDARAVLARQPLFKRLLMAANWALVGSPITIPGTLSLPLAEVAALLQAKLEETNFYGNN